MSEVVRYELRDGIGVITVDYPPVNALGQGVRAGLQACLRQGLADDGAQALVVIGTTTHGYSLPWERWTVSA